MNNLNVIDLDRTLIQFDSFRYFVLMKIRSGNIVVLIYTILRKIRLISAKKFKQSVIKHTNLLYDEKAIEGISSKIINSVNPEILDVVKQSTNDNTVNVLCSASPDIYVKKVADYLGWFGYGSYFKGKNFYHMYGSNKFQFIINNYPQSHYRYNFAISDSESDIELLKLFLNYQLVGK